MTISYDLTISNSISSFVPKYGLNWKILVTILMNFVDKNMTTSTKVYVLVHPWNLTKRFAQMAGIWQILKICPRVSPEGDILNCLKHDVMSIQITKIQTTYDKSDSVSLTVYM